MKVCPKLLGIMIFSIVIFSLCSLSGCVGSADDVITPPGKGVIPNTQFHNTSTIDTVAANVWYNVTWDFCVPDETTMGFLRVDSNQAIQINTSGIYRVQGCFHPVNNGVGNQEAYLYIRVLINDTEARCLQSACSKDFRAAGIDTIPYTGTIYANASEKVNVQYRVTNVNIDFEADAVFDNPVAASVNFERID